MINRQKGNVLGIAALTALLLSWGVLWIVQCRLARRLDGWLILIATILSVVAVVPSVVAGRMASKWWYAVAGAGLLSAALLLASLAV